MGFPNLDGLRVNNQGSEPVAAMMAQTCDWESLSRCLLCASERIRTVDPEYNLSRCEECGHVFDNPRPTLSAIIRYYSKPGKYDSWLANKAVRESLWKRRLRKLLAHSARGSLLDVGTGTGQFLNLARSHFRRVAGTEVSKVGVAIAKEQYNLDIAQGPIEECDLPRGGFDTITLFHVLEHVPDPQRTIETCRELLSPGGIIVVCVPNDVVAWTSAVKRLGKKLGLRSFQKFSPQFGLPQVFTSNEIHLSHFTPGVLRQSLQRAGLGVIEESLDPYYVASGTRLVLHAAYYGFHRVLYAASRANRYDTIWMVARA